MTTALPLLSAFLAGFLGSVHCIAMCGGIVGGLTLSLSEEVRRTPLRLFPYLFAYNGGRLLSYLIAGLLAGGLGAGILRIIPLQNPTDLALWVSGLLMIALGLYIGAWWQVLTWLEKGGAILWRRIEPFGRRFLPVHRPLQALALGLVWGWLPCGLVYSILTFALASGSALQGALLMLAFGVGTLPVLLAMGVAAQQLNAITQQPVIRRIAGALIIVSGLFVLFGPLS